ncbi:hypothetical protein ACWD4J_02000 [Streptomyces sp. NPDC002577]
MAKNKNRKQGAQQGRASQTEHAAQEAKSVATEAHSEIPQGNPADVARKQQRRFGHN